MLHPVVTRVTGWLQTVQSLYGVDARIFFVIAVASAVPFYSALSLMLRALARKDRGRVLAWAGVCLFSYISPWFYVLFFGRNLPWWVYILIGIFAAWCLYVLARRLRRHHGRSSPRTRT